jgi:hypothetical protein
VIDNPQNRILESSDSTNATSSNISVRSKSAHLLRFGNSNGGVCFMGYDAEGAAEGPEVVVDMIVVRCQASAH